MKRQHKIDERRAAEMMAEGNFHDALGIYDAEGRDPLDAHAGRGPRRAGRPMGARTAPPSPTKPASCSPTPMTTWTSSTPPCATCARSAASWARITSSRPPTAGCTSPPATASSSPAPTRSAASTTARPAPSRRSTAASVTVKLDGRAARRRSLSTPRAFDKFRHGYAGTIYKGQGRTLDQTYLYHSEHWRSAASYVALTRHRDKAELFVARNTARDVKQLARQMARTDDRRAASMFHHRAGDRPGSAADRGRNSRTLWRRDRPRRSARPNAPGTGR